MHVAFITLFSIVTFIALYQFALPIRNAPLHRIIENAKPVIAAIEKYKTDYGSWPKSLEEIQMHEQNTDVCGFQNYSYIKIGVGEDHELSDKIIRTGGYELFVKMPRGILNWDVFVFWPTKIYPTRMKGGDVVRIGDWAYVHE